MSIVLPSTNHSLAVALTEAPAVQPDFTVSYADETATTFVTGLSDGTLADAMETVILTAPPTNTQRIVRHISIYNGDETAINVAVKLVNAGIPRTISNTQLEPGGLLEYDGGKWQKFGASSTGSLALGETSSTAYWGDRGKIAYDHSQATHDKTLVGLSNVPNVDATNPANIAQDSAHRFVTDTEKETWNESGGITMASIAIAPAYYARDQVWRIKGSSVAADRYLIQSPNKMGVNINDSGYAITTQVNLDLGLVATWDTQAPTDYTVAANRAGKNFYVYACQPASGAVPILLASANSSYPSGYTVSSSRKVAGFHCLCATVGTISGHALTGYVAGDIIPASVWDLLHRPQCSPEGMVWSNQAKIWVDIYLQSGTGSSTASANSATITDTRMWNDHVDDLAAVGKRLLDDGEFQIIAEGSNQQTNISGSADPGTTGGHSDTAGRRMISNIGCEDCCGALWQWLRDQSTRWDGAGGWAWRANVGSKGSLCIGGDANDVKLLAGGGWAGFGLRVALS